MAKLYARHHERSFIFMRTTLTCHYRIVIILQHLLHGSNYSAGAPPGTLSRGSNQPALHIQTLFDVTLQVARISVAMCRMLDVPRTRVFFPFFLLFCVFPVPRFSCIFGFFSSVQGVLHTGVQVSSLDNTCVLLWEVQECDSLRSTFLLHPRFSWGHCTQGDRLELVSTHVSAS